MLPKHLSATTASGLVPDEPIAQFEIGDMQNFVYLVLDWKTREAAIVDPQKDLSAPLKALREHGFKLTRVLLTHTHHDHIAGVPELARTMPGARIAVHAEDLHRLPSPVRTSAQIEKLAGGDRLTVGEIELQALHTPGHSSGESCFFVAGTTPPYLLTGDTIFIRDCGRTDLPTGSTREMFESLQRIKKLPPETVILPGHHYARETASTLEREMRESPPFGCRSVQELEALP
jgi:hydroxyacylglutathione hydrolase